MEANIGHIQADRRFLKRSRLWWSEWLGRTAVWGYDRIVGALANFGCKLSHQTVANILRRNDIAPAPKREKTTTWKEFIRSHMNVLAGTDFFTVEVLTWRGLVTYYVLFFIEIGCRRIGLGGITRHPDREWMQQVARNATMEDSGYLKGSRYLLHDRDSKFRREFQDTLKAGGVICTPLPARSPNLNAYAERWVRSVKEECLSKLILFGEQSLRRGATCGLHHFPARSVNQGAQSYDHARSIDSGWSILRCGPCGSGTISISADW
jgi:hypothetical protein